MRPSARIEVNGQELSTRFVDQRGVLVSIAVTDEAGSKADAVEITIDDRDAFASAKVGDEIRVWLGYEPAPAYMGRYRVDTVRKTGPRRLMTVSAKAAELTGAFRVPKSRSWPSKTLGEIATTLAAEHGLTPAIAPEIAIRPIPHIDQQAESDLAFLTRLAGRSGAIFKVADGNLLLTRRGATSLPSGERNGVTTIRPGDLESWDWEAGGRGDFKAVSCTYRDDAAGLRKTATAGDPDAVSKYRDRRLYGSKAEAEAAAQAQLEAFSAGRVTARIEAGGLPQVFAESDVILDGFDAEMDRRYRVRSVRHRLDTSGFRSTIELEIGGGAEGEA